MRGEEGQWNRRHKMALGRGGRRGGWPARSRGGGHHSLWADTCAQMISSAKHHPGPSPFTAAGGEENVLRETETDSSRN